MNTLCVLMLALVGITGGAFVTKSVAFPPARPLLTNMENLCTQGGGRPRYPAKNFPARGYAHQRRCGSAINRVEAWYGMCCAAGTAEADTLCCATQAWEYALNQFCQEEFMVMDLPHQCCEAESDEKRLACFAGEAHNPSYQGIRGYKAPSVTVDLAFTWDPTTC
ncbi:extracellular matrix protein 1-like [Engraulis encrasicolus]|uniref:extracellular matrix protein 1-like n=1 Tax=Engraulis encrasicolus TaxID=184585 RepID=UPI002FD5D877